MKRRSFLKFLGLAPAAAAAPAAKAAADQAAEVMPEEPVVPLYADKVVPDEVTGITISCCTMVWMERE